jgi:hypothetical protein
MQSLTNSLGARALVLAALVGLALAAALTGASAAKADTYFMCSGVTASGPVLATDGRVYSRGYAGGCTGSFRVRITIWETPFNEPRRAVAVNYSDPLPSGSAGVGVFGPRCNPGSLYQGVTVAQDWYAGAWHDYQSATTGSPRRVC